jgi:hypothetical protein
LPPALPDRCDAAITLPHNAGGGTTMAIPAQLNAADYDDVDPTDGYYDFRVNSMFSPAGRPVPTTSRARLRHRAAHTNPNLFIDLPPG